METKKLIHRLSRIEGQLHALKNTLETEKQTDCTEIIRQTKTIIQALKGFARAYLHLYMNRCFTQRHSKKVMHQKLSKTIDSLIKL
ncbi:metal-sensitive transcriptional regulator [Candidatus Nomurabacteria bacterium]|nr:metal-sensitive transcriptional regulator [Candidatus Nomurabacteria bacterium]